MFKNRDGRTGTTANRVLSVCLNCSIRVPDTSALRMRLYLCPLHEKCRWRGGGGSGLKFFPHTS